MSSRDRLLKQPTIRITPDGWLVEYLVPEGDATWSLPVDKITLLAEYTTNEGPYLDDYFLVFVFRSADEWRFRVASFYAEGRDDVLASLAAGWGASVELGLQSSTQWRSRTV